MVVENMELNPLLIGPVSLLSGFSGADRILVGEYKGAALKVLLFIASMVLMVVPATSPEQVAEFWQPMQALVYFALAWWIFDAITVFSKMYDVVPFTTVFGVDVRWTQATSTRVSLAYVLFFGLVFALLFFA